MIEKRKKVNPIIKKILLKEEIPEDDKGAKLKNNGKFEEGCIDLLLELQDYSYEETLIKNKNLKASVIRKWLNELQSYHLTEYVRIRDKKTGWYAYKWKVREDNVLRHAKKIISDKIENLRNEIEYLKLHPFACSCRKYTFEEALELNFMCPKDNEEIKEIDKSEEIKKREKEIEDLEKLLKEVSKLKTIYES